MKVGLHEVLDRLGLRRAPGRPRQVHLSVTDRCFLPCLHCDIWKNEAADLPGEFWEDLVDRLAPWCAPAGMNFAGGEPLLRKDLERIMGRAVRRGFTVSFNTNGWLVTAERARAIAAAGVSVAYVSLDGMRAETVDHSRGRAGSFERAMAAIDRLDAEAGPRVVVATILHGRNAAEIPALLEFVERRGLQLVVQPLYQTFGPVPFDPGWWRTSPLWPADPGQRAAVEGALDLLAVARRRGGPVANPEAQLLAMKGYFGDPEGDDGLACRAGHTDLSIDPRGNLRLCYFLDPVGSAFDAAPLPVAWDGVAALRRRWEVSRCGRGCRLLNCNFERDDM